jgi:hypothetical protein
MLKDTMKPSNAALIAVLLMAPALCLAQSTASLAGTVVDTSGAVVPDAKVDCRNVETDLKASATTNSAGLFRFPELPVGLYELTISKESFGTLVRGGVRLLTEQAVDLTLTLRLGQTSQSVEVSAPVPLVQRTTSDLGTTVDSRQMSDLPLNGRNAFDLAALAPGAIETVAATIPGQQDNIGLAVNGLSSIDNNWQLDGATYTNRAFGSAPTLPNPDTLQEFTARTSNFDAASRGAGASVKLTTRSGTNQMHGTLFEFLRNDAMDARNFFDINVEPYKQNQYGGTLGGPIKKDKLFFFGSFQGTNQRGGPSPRSNTVPDALTRNGDFSKSGKIIVDPTTQNPFPNDIIPKNRMDSIALGLLPSIPLPNYGGNILYVSPSANRDDYQWLGKVDYTLSANDHLSGRYFWDRNTNQRDVNSVPGIYANNSFTNQTALVSETHTFSPSWVMTASFNYLRTFRTETPVAPVTMQQLGAKVPCASQNCDGKIFVSISGYTGIAISGGSVMQPAAEESQVDFSHASGRHFLRFGSGFRHTSDSAFVENDNEAGGWTFNATRTSSTPIKNSGDAFASFLLGVPSQFAQATSTPNRYLVTTFDAWVQDDWKIARRLTLNLGLRYDPWLPPHDARGYLPGFLPGRESTVAPLAPLGLVFGGDPGIPAAIAQNGWTTFSPRFGFAWDTFGDGKTIVRGGYGIFRSGTEFFGLVSTMANSVPFRTASVSIPDPPSTADPYAGYGPAPFPYTAPSSLANYKFANNIAVRALDPKAHAGYTQSWNFTMERQVTRDTAVTISYVGNHSLGILTRYQANPGLYGPGATTGNINSRRLYPGFGNLTLGGSFAWAHYNALQAQVTKRTAHGLTLLANYTYGKAMSIDSSGAFGTALGAGPRDPFNLSLDYSPADYDVAQQLKAALIYDLPAVHMGPAAVRRVVNGWQINSIVTARSGFPFTCRSGVDNSLTGVGNDTCDQIDPNSGRPAGANFLRTWFNTAAFTRNAIGTFGSAGRNDLRRPGMVNVNLSLFRRFKITEKLGAEFRAEAFNALNHTNFDLFYITNSYTNSENLTSPTFGQITHAQDPRLMQLALKLRF